MKILVTGGAGYIGSFIVSLLIKNRHDVVVVDNLSTGFREAVPSQALLVLADLNETAVLKKVIVEHQIEGIFHLAGSLNLSASLKLSLDYYQNNLGGLLSLLNACRNSSVKNFIFSSSCAVYGTEKNFAHECPVDALHEDFPKFPLTPYGKSKLFGEQILTDFCAFSDMKFRILRYFNVAGASDDLTNGQRTAHPYHLIHLAAQAAVGKIKRLPIWGNNYPTPDGSCIRDYIHVEDLAEMHLLSFKDLCSTQKSGVFNCGYGKGYSVKDVLYTMKSIAHTPFEVIESERRPGDPPCLIASTELFQNQFPGWAPQRNDLKLICSSALNWELQNLCQNQTSTQTFSPLRSRSESSL